MGYRVSSGYRFIGSKGDDLPIDGLLVGKGETIFNKVSKAFVKYSIKKQVAIKVVHGLVYIYPLNIKLERVVKIVNKIVK